MAKSSDRGGGPGTSTRGGVRSTMSPPFTGGANIGSQHNLSGTFDKPRSGGDNGLPTRVTDSMGGPKKGGPGKAIQTSTPGTIMTTRGGK